MTTAKPPKLPPAQASYVLRGHHAQIHAIAFYAGNRRLLTGDGDGFVISWDLATKRPVAGWRAHEKAILGLSSWSSVISSSVPRTESKSKGTAATSEAQKFTNSYDDDLVITHGRDGRIAVWRLDAATERLMHAYIPPDRLLEVTAKPALLNELRIGAVSFCAFSACAAPLDMLFATQMRLGENGATGQSNANNTVSKQDSRAQRNQKVGSGSEGDSGQTTDSKESIRHHRQMTEGRAINKWAHPTPLLIAAPSQSNSEDIDIFYLPSGQRKTTVSAPKANTNDMGKLSSTGMVMAILLDVSSSSSSLILAAGYESGDVLVYSHDPAKDAWITMYRTKPHTQPILSLTLHPARRICISSSADALLVKHPFSDRDILAACVEKENVPQTGGSEAPKRTYNPLKISKTGHAGQQGLSMRNDGRIFASAGWDSRVRVYSARTMRELAVLKLHRQGCYATALATVEDSESYDPEAPAVNTTNGQAVRGKGKVAEKKYGNVILRLDRLNRRYRLKLAMATIAAGTMLTPESSQDSSFTGEEGQGAHARRKESEESSLWAVVNERVAELKRQNPNKLHEALAEYEEWAAAEAAADRKRRQQQQPSRFEHSRAIKTEDTDPIDKERLQKLWPDLDARNYLTKPLYSQDIGINNNEGEPDTKIFEVNNSDDDDDEEKAGNDSTQQSSEITARAADTGLLPPSAVTNNFGQHLLSVLERYQPQHQSLPERIRNQNADKQDNDDASTGGGDADDDQIKRDESGAEILVPATPEKSVAMARYERRVASTHWLAAGSKDGTVSLWDVF